MCAEEEDAQKWESKLCLSCWKFLKQEMASDGITARQSIKWIGAAVLGRAPSLAAPGATAMRVAPSNTHEVLRRALRRVFLQGAWDSVVRTSRADLALQGALAHRAHSLAAPHLVSLPLTLSLSLSHAPSPSPSHSL